MEGEGGGLSARRRRGARRITAKLPMWAREFRASWHGVLTRPTRTARHGPPSFEAEIAGRLVPGGSRERFQAEKSAAVIDNICPDT